ncbi:YesL family protein [Lederbergia galactosidilytica]|uniref:DUF624 domain-containing protein n=2 Tax=Lederbergia galactosidilytica TaxID=217031 RepID=A0A178A5C5_9BACI|nr:DUF624 domain-containing protein [Lederbergia galactosidilytica]KRG10552.1 hypothetical protein ACA30_21540 [Virgibacillus soli]MBP1916497.1 putative membrane protein YesL [Lederbergia galactosidilytica]OAK75406.1 hypothetical protein ABB05_02500 [Lederbergia galactosidilytica]
MNILNSRLYSILETVSFFFLLNILWFIMCLPIITIFPATAAMFGVVRQYVMKKDSAVFIPFFRFFKDNFKQSFILGIITFVFIYVFYIDFMLISTLGNVMQNLLLASLFLIALIGTLTFIYIFPMMVHYKLTLWAAIKNSFFFSIKYFPTTLLSIIFIGLMLVVLYYMPVAFLAIFSFMAYVVFLICYSRFHKEGELAKKHQLAQE